MGPAGPATGRVAPRSVLAIYAHPDDPAVSCGGTLASWAAAGAEVHVCLCCDGDKGLREVAADGPELARRRRHEAGAAGRQLGVRAHHWLGYPDGAIDNGPELRGRLVALVRELRPEAVLAPDPTAVFFGPNSINHRDHRVVGWAVLDAISPAAASPHYFPGKGPPWQVATMYLSGTREPDYWVDITGWIDIKAAALACHVSQISDGAQWPSDVVRERAQEAGRAAGVDYAEAYRRVVLA
ncbi:MAG: PIG-L deacetylase family protein [Acidimicrobiales bacterium]